MAGVHAMLLGAATLNSAGGGVMSTLDLVDPFGDSSGVALWRFNDNGNDAGGVYTLTPVNITYALGYFSNAAIFNGSAYFNVPVLPQTGNEITISFWANFSTNAEMIVLDTGVWNTTSGIGFYKTTGNKLRIIFKKSASVSISITVETVISLNSFTHIVIIKTATMLFVYFNNVLVDTFTHNTDTAMISNSAGYIGRQIGSSSYLNGKLDQFRIFNRALTQAEVAALYTESITT